MLKGKLKIPEKALKVFPDSLGSLVKGFDDTRDAGGVDGLETASFDFGEELETFHPNGFVSDREESDFEKMLEEDLEVKVRPKPDKEYALTPDSKHVIEADEKRSDLEYELSQEEINLEKLQRIASTGIPDGGTLRATAWKLLLGYLPPSRDLWDKVLTENRQKYAELKDELLSTPVGFPFQPDFLVSSTHYYRHNYHGHILQVNFLDLSRQTQFSGREEGSGSMKKDDKDSGGPLMRHDVSSEDHPLSLGEASEWHKFFEYTEIAQQIDRDLQRTHPEMKYFSADTSQGKKTKEAMRNILFLFAKLNPTTRYVQGMNEVLAPIYYIFSTDSNEQNAANAEADSFACFVRLLSDSVDHFCQQLDNNTSVGILSTLSRLKDILKANDEQLWNHLEFKSRVNPQFYAFRWITLLLTQEFEFNTILRIWDSLLSHPIGVQDMLLRICCAMLLCVKSRLLNGDFAANLNLLQHYPEINMEHLLQVAREINTDTTSLSFRVSI
ncbi:hypothetical protein V2J09_010334 [Rumex salicifolius]